jgi:hypothetical protein
MTPEAMQAARDAIKQEKELNELQAQHLGEQVKNYDQQVKFARDAAAVDEAAQARAMQLNEQKNAAVAADIQKYQEASDAYSKMKPQSYWGRMDTGNRILAAISLGLGAMGAGMARTPNYAMQILQGKIEDDLAAQREARDLAGAHVGELRGAIGITSRLYDDKILQNEAAAAMTYRQVERQLGIMALQYQGTEVGNRAEEMKVGAGVIAAQKEAQLQAASTARVSQSFATRAMPERTITTQDLTGQAAKEQGLLDWRDVAKDKAQLSRYVKFAGAVANTPEDYKQLVEDHTETESITSLLQELISYRQKAGGVVDFRQLPSKDRSRIITISKILATKIADRAKLPLRSDKSWELLEQLAPNPTKFIDFSEGEYQATIDSIRNDERINVDERSTPVVNIPGGRRPRNNESIAGASTFRPVGAE